MAPSGTYSRAFLTEWNLVIPPDTSVCLKNISWDAQYFFQYSFCSLFKTIINSKLHEKEKNCSIVLNNIGLPSISKNCLAIFEDILEPVPPAVIMIYCLLFISTSHFKHQNIIQK